MKAAFRRLIPIGLTLALAASAFGQAIREPSIGYVFPAGGRQGATLQITVGGQFLRELQGIHVTGGGVTVTSLQYLPPLNGAQMQELRSRLEAIREARRPDAKKRAAERPAPDAETKRIDLPDYPEFRNLETKSLEELMRIVDMFLNPERRQQSKRSIMELAVIEIQIAPYAAVGERELRLITVHGMTNPLPFHVGDLPEFSETNPKIEDDEVMGPAPLPAVFNGRIMPGETDRFTFKARRGQKLVLQAQARQLVPYMADAVPGWLQATLALYDDEGHELAFADDYQIHPDPVMFYVVPDDGEYTVEIRDSIYRGREDFIYRLSVGELPFVTSMFPLGGATHSDTIVALTGWNLPSSHLKLDASPGTDRVRVTSLTRPGGRSNTLLYEVSDIPAQMETEPNNDFTKAQALTMPVVINGRIQSPGDTDIFRIKGRAGDEIVAEVLARRLNSPLDSLLRVEDSTRKTLAWNDDHPDPGAGLVIHQADSFVRVKLPEDGTYYICLSDAQSHGGKEYAYRLRVSAPRPDFELRIVPSSVFLPLGGCAPVSVTVIRRDGFDGEITLDLEDASGQLSLSGGRIPAGRDRVTLTLAANGKPTKEPLLPRIKGRAVIAGKEIIREAVPAQDMMQAFGYRHLVPSQELAVHVLPKNRRWPQMSLAHDGPIEVPAGGRAAVRITVPLAMNTVEPLLALKDAPAGFSLGDVRLTGALLTFPILADGEMLKPGYADNLIVEVSANLPVGPAAENGERQKHRISLGYMPAIPVTVVQP